MRIDKFNFGKSDAYRDFKDDDEMKHYFDAIGIDNKVFDFNSDYFIISGSIGSGKSCLAKFIEKTVKKEDGILFCIKKLEPEDYSEHYGYVSMFDKTSVSLWEFIFYKEILNIYISYCSEKKIGVPHDIKGLNKKIDSFRQRAIKYWVVKEHKIKTPVYEGKREEKDKYLEINLNNIVKEIATVLKESNLKKFFVIFDEIDLLCDSKANINDLIRAISNINSDFNKNKKIKIVLCLRDEYVSRLSFKGFGKLKRDCIYNLNEQLDKQLDKNLKGIILHRINSLNSEKYCNFEDFWNNLFPEKIKINREVYDNNPNVEKEYTPNIINSWDYVKSYTLNRPRDFIEFLRECKNLNYAGEKLTNKELEVIVQKYAKNYYFDMACEEINIYEEIISSTELYNLFASLSNKEFNYKQFKYCCDNISIKEEGKAEMLFGLFLVKNIIGEKIMTSSEDNRIEFAFSYLTATNFSDIKNPELSLKEDARYALHKGLQRLFTQEEIYDVEDEK